MEKQPRSRRSETNLVVKAETPERTEETEEKKDSFLDFLKELPVLIVVAFGIALLIKTFLVQAFYIPSESMEPTLLQDDRVLVSKLSYRLGEPEYGDVVVFRSENQPTVIEEDRGPVGNFIQSLKQALGLASSEYDLIKRVIATEDQTVEVKEGAVFVDGKKLQEPYRKDPDSPLPDFAPKKVRDGEVFVMGDNRFNSTDSRVFGSIEESAIVGRAFILIWPIDRIDWMSRF